MSRHPLDPFSRNNRILVPQAKSLPPSSPLIQVMDPGELPISALTSTQAIRLPRSAGCNGYTSYSNRVSAYMGASSSLRSRGLIHRSIAS
jgi:hypothetical protein